MHLPARRYLRCLNYGEESHEEGRLGEGVGTDIE
jgi:hypothetical protein